MTSSSIINISNLKDFQSTIQSNSKVVVHFWAGWCEPCTLLDQILDQLNNEYKSAITCIRVEAEEAPDISDHYKISAVPYFLFFTHGSITDKIEGANPAELSSKFISLATSTTIQPTQQQQQHGTAELSSSHQDDLSQRLQSLINQRPVMLFMKGSPDAPRCGFSAKVVQAIRDTGISDFGSFDILADEAVRQGLKAYSKWPTYPQLYVKGELLGGCDIVLEMASTGDLKQELAGC